MKRILSTLIIALCLSASCERYETVKEVDTDFVTNYEAFWNMVDQQYCFLGTKFNNDKNVNWKAIYDKWMPIVQNEIKDEYELFNIMGKSLDVLKDGHIWMISDFKIYSNNEYYQKPDGSYYGDDFVPGLVENKYLRTSNGEDDYSGDKVFTTRNGIVYGTIEREGKKFAYIYYDDFTVEIQDIDFKYIDPVVQEADAIILDIRDNPGGSGVLGLSLAGHFINEKTLVGYTAHKNGSGHDDFTEPHEMYCSPSEKYNWKDKQTALLTNRGVYSTANLFTHIMHEYAPNVIQVGQKSGGGGGLPMTHYLPNGWLVVFSSNILLDEKMNHIEPGISPDVEAEIGDYTTTGKDGIVESAIEELLKKL